MRGLKEVRQHSLMSWSLHSLFLCAVPHAGVWLKMATTQTEQFQKVQGLQLQH